MGICLLKFYIFYEQLTECSSLELLNSRSINTFLTGSVDNLELFLKLKFVTEISISNFRFISLHAIRIK